MTETVHEICERIRDRDYRGNCNVEDIRLANRIEAAHKRELDELRKQVGNAAKLREALAQCYYLAFQWEANEREGIVGVEPDAMDSAETLLEIQQITTAALDAPARNCDKYATFEDALIAWRLEPPNGQALHEWLFATAKEGGAK